MPNNAQNLLRHPSSLWWLSVVYALFMWAFGSQMAGVTLYLINVFDVPQNQAYSIFAAYSALIWTLPLIGGWLGSQFGLKFASGLSLFVCAVGAALLSIGSYDSTLIALAIFVLGGAVFTPSLWCLVDHAYKKNDLRRESGFTLFYLLFNLGAVVGIFASGYLQVHFSYRFSFEVSACLLVLGLLIYLFVARNLHIEPTRSVKPLLNWPPYMLAVGLVIAFLIASPIVIFFFHHLTLTNSVMTMMAVFASLSLVYIALRQKDKVLRYRVFGFLILVLFSNVFWALYALEPSLVSVFIDHSVKHELLGFHLSSSATFGFEGTFVIMIGLLLSRLWTTLAKREIKVALSVKFSLAMILIGLGYFYLRLLMSLNGFGQILALGPVVFAYAFFATGELFIGPLGISMVGRLSPQGSEGYFMGVLQLYMGYASIITGFIAQYAVLPKGASLIHANHIFGNMFMVVAFASICIGAILLVLTPLMRRLM